MIIKACVFNYGGFDLNSPLDDESIEVNSIEEAINNVAFFEGKMAKTGYKTIPSDKLTNKKHVRTFIVFLDGDDKAPTSFGLCARDKLWIRKGEK